MTGENPETEENSVAGENLEDRLSVDPCPVVEAKGKIRYGTVFGQYEGAAALCGSLSVTNLSLFIPVLFPGSISQFFIPVFYFSLRDIIPTG